MYEERIKNVQQQKDIKYWSTDVGQHSFSVFKNISKKELKLTVEYTSPVQLELKRKKNQLRMKPGQCDAVQGKILNMENNNFGQMSYSIETL